VKYIVAIAFALCLAAAPARAETYLSLDFEDLFDALDHFNHAPHVELGEEENGALGLFNTKNDRHDPRTTLELEGLPGDGALLRFDLVLLGHWDDQGDLADRFWVEIEDAVLYELTEFPCEVVDGDEERPIGAEGRHQPYGRNLGYWIVPVEVEIPGSAVQNGEVEITFDASLTGKKTEFFALDNLEVVSK
jgi:hypothetical protein